MILDYFQQIRTNLQQTNNILDFRLYLEDVLKKYGIVMTSVQRNTNYIIKYLQEYISYITTNIRCSKTRHITMKKSNIKG